MKHLRSTQYAGIFQTSTCSVTVLRAAVGVVSGLDVVWSRQGEDGSVCWGRASDPRGERTTAAEASDGDRATRTTLSSSVREWVQPRDGRGTVLIHSSCLSLHCKYVTDLTPVYSPFDAHCCRMGTTMKHPVPDRVKPSFVIFDIRALWRSAQSGTGRFIIAVPIWQQWASKG